ncbi:MAG: L-threonylcarbamoyladenylate synthase [Methylobacter sp.]|nr:L-threonylcarbamoyladenylate synthase [Methylobacter sp.]
MPYHSPFKIRNAVRHIKAGSVIAYPTEAVYGLGCDPLNEDAVMSLLNIKQRPIEKGLILIASSLDQLRPYLVLDQTIIDRIIPTWPGPVTWIIPARPWVPAWLTGKQGSLAVRVTNHPIAHDLCAQFGSPLVSTSANPSTRPAIKESRKLLKAFADSDIFIIHGKVGALKQETVIYNAVTGEQLR